MNIYVYIWMYKNVYILNIDESLYVIILVCYMWFELQLTFLVSIAK